MLRLISDQNFNGPILRGLFRSQPDLDLVRPSMSGWRRPPIPSFWHGRPRRGGSYSLMTSIPSPVSLTTGSSAVNPCLESSW